jgi:cytochrome o ubiquinol oxidase operon protein cyoD
MNDKDDPLAEDATRDEGDLAPGLALEEDEPHVAVRSYAVGLALSVLLTVASFYVLGTELIWRPAIPIALLALAVAQIGVHLVFFLHITTAPDNTNNVLALAFGVLIVALIVAGSLWIMMHLNRNMLPMSEVMRMQS